MPGVPSTVPKSSRFAPQAEPPLEPADADGGFTLIEVLVAAALVALMGFVGLSACKAVAAAQGALRSDAGGPLDAQAARLRDDAASAFAVFLPATDMNGRPNDGQEVDFYAAAADGSRIFWRYLYDPATSTVRRWDYDAAGRTGMRDVRSGAIDTAAAYPPLRGVTAFRASALPADGLGDPGRNVYHGLAAIFAQTPQALPVRYTAAGAAGAAIGGNGVVQVALCGPAGAALVHLAAGSMPTGFTVTGALLWHAVVYRVDQSHRFFLGPAGKSHVFINARVDVSYDGWTTRQTWCDFNLLGNPDGLDPHDPHADYKPDEPVEQADNIIAACRQLHPLPPARTSD